jgi:hypothetical protein
MIFRLLDRLPFNFSFIFIYGCLIIGLCFGAQLALGQEPEKSLYKTTKLFLREAQSLLEILAEKDSSNRYTAIRKLEELGRDFPEDGVIDKDGVLRRPTLEERYSAVKNKRSLTDDELFELKCIRRRIYINFVVDGGWTGHYSRLSEIWPETPSDCHFVPIIQLPKPDPGPFVYYSAKTIAEEMDKIVREANLTEDAYQKRQASSNLSDYAFYLSAGPSRYEEMTENAKLEAICYLKSLTEEHEWMHLPMEVEGCDGILEYTSELEIPIILARQKFDPRPYDETPADGASDAAHWQSKTIVGLGDRAVTPGGATQNTVLTLSRTMIAPDADPVGEDHRIFDPHKEGKGGELRIIVEGVDWLNALDLSKIGSNPAQFSRKTNVIVQPQSYRGDVPANDESKARWAAELGLTEDVESYFPVLELNHGRSEFYLTLPSVSFLVILQAGAQYSPGSDTELHGTDPYDNFSVTIESRGLIPAADAGKNVSETLVLGDEFDNLTTRNEPSIAYPHGFVHPNGKVAYTSNAAGDSIERLLDRSYALYHPKVQNPESDGGSDVRDKVTQRGKSYHFSTFVSGIDRWGNDVSIQNGKDMTHIYFGKDEVSYVPGHGLYELIEYFSPNQKYNLGDFYLYSKKSRGMLLLERTLFKESHAVTIQVFDRGLDYAAIAKNSVAREGKEREIFFVKFVAHKDETGQWYYSEFQTVDLRIPFTWVKSTKVSDEYDARLMVESKRFGPIKQIRYAFTADTATTQIHFQSRKKSDGPFSETAMKTIFDELRFDSIILVESEDRLKPIGIDTVEWTIIYSGGDSGGYRGGTSGSSGEAE